MPDREELLKRINKINGGCWTEMRKLRSEKRISTYKLAAMFGVSQTVCQYIVNRKLWTHI